MLPCGYFAELRMTSEICPSCLLGARCCLALSLALQEFTRLCKLVTQGLHRFCSFSDYQWSHTLHRSGPHWPSLCYAVR